MPDLTCLKRHLLYASVQAYHPAVPDYNRGSVPWLEPPQAVGGRSIDFALVGRFPQGLVIAFRGTLPPLDLRPDGSIVGTPLAQLPRVLRDWRNSLNGLELHPDAPAGRRPALPGRIHRGFAGSLNGLFDDIAAEIDRLRAGEEAIHLYFTGHSKGGAIANLAALCARHILPRATVKAVTFGAPRAGDAVFAEAYRAAGIDCQRFEVAGDPVTGVPPQGVAVGTGHPVASVSFPLLSRRRIIPKPIANHLPYREFGYDRHVYEAGGGPEWS